MAQTIKIKRSSTSGNKLTSSNSVAGELGLNTADKALYIQTGSSNGDVVTVAHESTLKIDEANNRVGIGTTSPSYPLDVHVADGNTVNFRSTDNRMQIRLVDNDTTGYLGVENSTFYLGLNAGIGEDNLSIKSDGSVGIGTTSPVANLDVKIAEETVANVLAGSYAAAFTSTTSGNTGHATGILLSGSSGSNRGAAIVAEAQGSGNNHDLIFSTSSSGATPTERMRIDDLGNVGIGITDPATNLHISSTDSSTFTIQNSTNAGNASLHFRDENNVDQYKVLYDLPNNRAEQHFNGNGLRFYSNQISAEVAKIGFGNGYNSSYFAGRVGIGTDSPRAKLDIRAGAASSINEAINFGRTDDDLRYNSIFSYNTSSTNSYLSFKIHDGGSSVAQTETMVIGPGKVGIGTNSPVHPLHVLGTGNNHQIRVERTGTGKVNLGVDTVGAFVEAQTSIPLRFYESNAERVRLTSGKVIIGDTASHTTDLLQIETPASGGGHGIQIRRNDANSDQNIGHILFGNNTDTDLVKISAKTDGDSNAGDSGALLFSTQPTSGSLTERMRIDSSGNVGIGDTAPSFPLDVNNTSTRVRFKATTGHSNLELSSIAGRDYLLQSLSNGEFTIHDEDSNANRLNISTAGAITFNNAFTFPTADGSANQVLKTDGSGNITFGTVTAGAASSLVDADGDTQIQVEESSDEDIIRFDVAGNEFATFAQTGSEHYFRLFRRGTTAKASFSFDGTGLKTDVDSGYHSLVVKNNGSEQLRVTSGGNVGISTTSPASRLQINGASADSWNRNIGLSIDDTEIGKIVVDSAGIKYRTMVSGDHHYFRNSANNTTLLIRDDSKVGINETSPEGSLHISNAAQASLVLQGDASNSGDSGEIDAAIYMLMDKGAGTDPFGGTTHGAHGIRLSTENHSGATAFRIDDWDNGSYHSRMYINTLGNVGIGVTDPAAKLEVKHDSNATNGVIVENTSTGTAARSNVRLISDSAQLDIYATSSTYSGVSSWPDAGVISTSSNTSGGLIFNAQSAGLFFQTGTNERMRIPSTGGVSIGTTTAPGSGGLLVDNDIKTNSRIGIGSPGNTSTPALYNNSDTDTGVYWPAANTLGFVTGGTERATIDGSGRVGIGTSSPENLLHLASSSDYEVVFDYTGQEKFRLRHGTSGLYLTGPNTSNLAFGVDQNHDVRMFNTSGSGYAIFDGSTSRVGIGTTSPDAKLQVAYNGGHTSGNISLTHSALDLYNPLEANTDEKGAILTFSDHYQDANGYPRTVRAAIKGGTDTVGNTADGFLAFYTDSGGANSATERMRITKDGHVGIGTASPASALSGSNTNLTIEDADGSDIKLKRTAGMDLSVGVTSSNTGYIWTGGSYNILFGTAGTERMRLNSSGDWMVSNTVANVASAYSNQGGCGWVDSDLHFEAATTSNRSAAEFGRNNANSGDVITIRQQGTSVGAIGTEGGDSLFIQSNGSTGVGLRFHPSTTNIDPVRQGARIDNTVSLGSSTHRFKDLQLSNAANIGHASIETSSTSTSATTQVAIATFAAATFRSAEFTIQVTNSTDSTYHMTKVLLIHDGTTPGITEYGTVFTGGAAEATFDADISSGNVRLLATPASTDSMTFKVVRHCITV